MFLVLLSERLVVLLLFLNVIISAVISLGWQRSVSLATAKRAIFLDSATFLCRNSMIFFSCSSELDATMEAIYPRPQTALSRQSFTSRVEYPLRSA